MGDLKNVFGAVPNPLRPIWLLTPPDGTIIYWTPLLRFHLKPKCQFLSSSLSWHQQNYLINSHSQGKLPFSQQIQQLPWGLRKLDPLTLNHWIFEGVAILYITSKLSQWGKSWHRETDFLFFFLNGYRSLAESCTWWEKSQSGGQIRVTFTARKWEATTRGRPSAMWLIQEDASQEHSTAPAP